MKKFIAIVGVLISLKASASDMAGIGLAVSLPITVLLLIIASLVAFMSSTNSGFKYIYGAIVVAIVIAVIMAGYNWKLESDISMYRWHLFFTMLMVVPPILLKFKLKRSENT